MLDRDIEAMVPAGWFWTLYGPTDRFGARAVITSPDYRRHIGREGRTTEAALRLAVKDARAGANE